MCGIFGYIGKKPVAKTLINGLKKLEYRGYDSAGLAIGDTSNLISAKAKGQVSVLENKIKDSKLEFSGSLGISHTRWATHGEPSEKNAHPHSDCKNEIAISHNGIIENHTYLKKLLKKEGHKFKSETDSEVLAHLIEKFYQGNLEQAVAKALKLVSGSFALAVISAKEDKIVCARMSSPLAIGVAKNEMFIASDATALLEHTKKVIYLNDGEMAVISENDYKVTKLNGKKVDPKIEKLQMDIEQIAKKGYKHFMLKEIFEQDESLANVLRGRVKAGKIKLSVNFDPSKLKRIIITACGTSWHSALIAKHYFESISNIKAEVDYASEYRYRDPIIDEGDLMVVISQSGETADTLAALSEAKKKGAQTLGIINVIGSTIARETDSGIYLYAGPEIGVASTKAFSSQVTALLLLALYIKQEKGEKLDKKLLADLKKLPEFVNQALKENDKIKKIAQTFSKSKNFLYLGRQLNFPLALEGALKLKEISYIHAEGYPAAEIKHGPIALIDKNMPVVFIASKNGLSDKLFSNMQEIKARGGIIISITDTPEAELKKVSDYIIKIPLVNKLLSPVVATISLQLLAYHIANIKKLNVDKPRNLAKSVTVE